MWQNCREGLRILSLGQRELWEREYRDVEKNQRGNGLSGVSRVFGLYPEQTHELIRKVSRLPGQGDSSGLRRTGWTGEWRKWYLKKNMK